jgi:hypothetical protein
MGVVKKGSQKSNINVDHMTKQKKKKNLSNEYVYCSIDGIVEMHKLSEVYIGETPLGNVLKSLEDKNDKVNGRLDKSKNVIIKLNGRLKKIEEELKKYGMGGN